MELECRQVVQILYHKKVVCKYMYRYPINIPCLANYNGTNSIMQLALFQACFPLTAFDNSLKVQRSNKHV